MRKAIKQVLFALITISSASCKKSMESADYMRYVLNNENGLKKTEVVDGWQYIMQYKPHEYIHLSEKMHNQSMSELSERLVALKGTAWFNISIKKVDNSYTVLRYGVTSLEEYNNRLNYYLNEANNDISLLYGTDTLKPISYLFENNYNLSPQETMVVGFYLTGGDEKPKKRMRLSFVDRILKNGIINAEYSENTLKQIPTLVY